MEQITPEEALRIAGGRQQFSDIEDIPTDDSSVLCGFSRSYFEGLGKDLDIRHIPYPEIRNLANKILVRSTTTAHPSPFKLVSAFTLAFAECAPISETMDGSILPCEVVQIPNHQNILIGIEFSLYSLQGGTINHTRRGTLTISEPIRVSNHFKTDLVHAVSRRGVDDFHWLSLVYESATYKSNPEIEDR